MKVTFDTAELKTRLGQLSAVIKPNSTNLNYSRVRVFTETSVVKLQGIDIDSTLTLTLPGAKSDSAETDVLLDYDALQSPVQKLAAKETVLNIKGDGEAILSSGRFRLRLTVYPSKNFTENSLIAGIASGLAERTESFAIGLPGFQEQIEQTVFSLPSADGKFVCASLLVESTPDTLRLVATDGTMMPISSAPANIGTFKFTMPKLLVELVKILNGGTVATVSETEGTFYIETELELLTYNKNHSVFPPYERIVPAPGYNTTSIVLPASVVNDLDLVSEGCNEDDEEPGIVFSVDGNGKDLKLTAVNTQKLATGDVFMDAADNHTDVTSIGEALTVRVNYKKISEFIKRASFPVTMYAKGPQGIIDFHAKGSTPEKPTYRFLLMPMRYEGGTTSLPINND
jgi:DNA polymerase III sliding clamp (beta) subunit (PCNA family)